jgi:hypothetical protein
MQRIDSTNAAIVVVVVVAAATSHSAGQLTGDDFL